MLQDNNLKFNWPFFGNKHIIDFLQQGIANGRLAHFYIFSGARDLGKSTIAKYFANSLLCENFSKRQRDLPCMVCASCRQAQKNIHSDIIWLDKENGKKNISVEQVRDFIRVMSMGTFFGKYKIGIVKSADDLSSEAANALLKTLEEPKGDKVIILLANFMENLPMTILSRAQVLNFLPVGAGDIYDYLLQEHQTGRDQAKTLSRFCLGRPALAVKFLQDNDFLQNKLKIVALLSKIMSAPIYKRFLLIEDVLKCADKDEDNRDYAEEVLYLWQLVARDLILNGINAHSLSVADGYVEKKEFSADINKLLSIHKHIEKGKKYLAANVLPKLVLENISLQF
ncbi:hypothetical protein COT95_02770 [Candidatus Falkowbacteria bacterium CG10_big_fil_rev_8_21_14_0_10_37_6]|uniref:DNA polymerase III subunit delta n=1 Tax=Candidatus Falkowbacteria bacterium CG10_big_fil_rev_8_21_14_0_10_37_6 TaxID=1974563 RepID=A0A2H0V8K1_9BACT|nr:MAG: hypothetical protein COT95_02770 [Candidatus Falkowbacteria bacterium CG10_big_fil_rev_8_21_14_0_10_37_6]